MMTRSEIMEELRTFYGKIFNETANLLEADSKPLTEAEVWANDEIMAVNAEAGLPMSTVLKFARATETAHGVSK